jgi:hypothetical protein
MTGTDFFFLKTIITKHLLAHVSFVLFTKKSVPVIFEPRCIYIYIYICWTVGTTVEHNTARAPEAKLLLLQCFIQPFSWPISNQSYDQNLDSENFNRNYYKNAIKISFEITFQVLSYFNNPLPYTEQLYTVTRPAITHKCIKVSYITNTVFVSNQLDTYLLHTPWSRVLLEKLTVNFAASQEIWQLDTRFLFSCTFISILYMFRAAMCPPS